MSGIRSLNWADRDGSMLTPSGCRSMAVAVLGLLCAATAVIMARGLAGALAAPLEPAVLLTTGALVAAAAAVVRLGWLLPLAGSRVGRLDPAVMAITSLAAATLCGELCLPSGTLPVAVWFLCGIVLAEEGWAWLWFLRKRGQNCLSPSKSPADRPLHEKNCSVPSSAASEETIPAAEVVQRLTRCQAADGAEELSGWLRLPFTPGQRTGNVHVAFCPPLRVTPEVAVEQIAGPEARIKTAQLLPYGARFDLKLAAAAVEPTTVLLQFTARAPREE
jgi:hypothetical protein